MPFVKLYGKSLKYLQKLVFFCARLSVYIFRVRKEYLICSLPLTMENINIFFNELRHYRRSSKRHANVNQINECNKQKKNKNVN